MPFPPPPLLPYYPDASRGKLIDEEHLQPILMANDGAPANAESFTKAQQAIIDWIAYRTGGPNNLLNYRIIGNGEPPAAGYTPTVRPIWIKGALGMKVDSLEASPAVQVWTFTGYPPPLANASPGVNKVTGKAFAKAHATITLDGVGGYAIAPGGLNVASCVVHADGGAADPGYVEVQWVDPFGSADYAPDLLCKSDALSFNASTVGAQSPGSVRCYFYSFTNAARLDPATQAFSFQIKAYGAQ